MPNLAIAEYALLSDSHSAALVSRGGVVEWLCWPRFDSPAIFSRLLDDEAGSWAIHPSDPAEASRRYRDGTLVLETRFITDGGEVLLVDALAMGEHNHGHGLGEDAPHALLREIHGVRGEVELVVVYTPRPEYGIVHPLLTPCDGGVLGRGGAAVLCLSSPVSLDIDGSSATARLVVRAGDSLAFALQHRSSSEPAPEPWTSMQISRRLEQTEHAWRSWSELHRGYQGPWKELVQHSGRVLQALTYLPTGAMVAAPTTSLPEAVGGGRNWDYRFCWVRDASFTMEALWVAACPHESQKFFEFLAYAALSQVRRGNDLQIMFGIGGEHDLTERELPHLSGWRGSRPVRIGNGAWNQRQLDVYGELLNTVYRFRDRLPPLDQVTREFLVTLADLAGRRWEERDQGIWEIRGEPRHFTYSKLMCWVALDRAIRMAGQLGAEDRVPEWSARRDAIRRAILERGWSDRARAFTQSFGDDALDASNLLVPMVGFLPATDPKVRATINATVERLTDDRGLVFRYRSADGLDGGEGTFLLSTFWLAEAQALVGDLSAAKATFHLAAGFANDVGLLSEEVDPATGELLGNFPQAFSHIGLVNAAWAIAQAESLNARVDRSVGGRSPNLDDKKVERPEDDGIS